MTTIACPPYAIRGTRRALIVLCSTILMVSMSGVVMPARDHSRTGDDGREGSVWVVNRDLGELAVFDAKTGKVVIDSRSWGRGHTTSASPSAPARPTSPPKRSTPSPRSIPGPWPSNRSPISPLPHHIEPSHDGRTVYVSLASHTNTDGNADIRGHRHRRQLGQLHHDQRQSGGAIARSLPIAAGKDGLRRARYWATRSRASTPRPEISISASRPS